MTSTVTTLEPLDPAFGAIRRVMHWITLRGDAPFGVSRRAGGEP